jgi:hypothetical protein
MTTTHRGRHPARTAATRPLRPPRAAACSCAPSAAASHRRSARRPGLPGRSAVTRRRPRAPGPGPPPIPDDQRATRQHRLRQGPLGHRPSRSTARQPTGTSTRSCGGGADCLDLVPAPPSEVGGDRRVRTDGGGHRTDGGGHRTGWTPDGLDTRRAGHQTAGRWTGGRQTAGRVDSSRLDRQTRTTTQVTGHRTAGHQTAGQPDPGR